MAAYIQQDPAACFQGGPDGILHQSGNRSLGGIYPVESAGGIYKLDLGKSLLFTLPVIDVPGILSGRAAAVSGQADTLQRRSRAAEDQPPPGRTDAQHRSLDRVIMRHLVLFVNRIVLILDDDQERSALQWGEHGGTRADRRNGPAGADLQPLRSLIGPVPAQYRQFFPA